MSELEEMPHTCKRIEIPPKPNKKEVNIIFIESFLQAILEIEAIPFVISINPLMRGIQKEVSILINSKTGVINIEVLFRIPLDFKIEIILENNTINPPIRKIVEVALVILSAITSPRLFNDTFLYLEFLKFECFM